MLKQLNKNLKKDITIEFRNKAAFSVSAAFAVIVTIATGLVSGGTLFSNTALALLLWLIIFFTAMNGLIHIFVREEDQQTALLLRLAALPEAVYLAKFICNLLFFFLLLVLIVPLYVVFLQVPIISVAGFILSVVCGGIAVAATVTFMAALVAKSRGKEALLAILSFPLLVPVLWVAVISTRDALEKNGIMFDKLFFLLAFSGGVILLSLLLFRFIWYEE